jgi:hypothetical protein
MASVAATAFLSQRTLKHSNNLLAALETSIGNVAGPKRQQSHHVVDTTGL